MWQCHICMTLCKICLNSSTKPFVCICELKSEKVINFYQLLPNVTFYIALQSHNANEIEDNNKNKTKKWCRLPTFPLHLPAPTVFFIVQICDKTQRKQCKRNEARDFQHLLRISFAPNVKQDRVVVWWWVAYSHVTLKIIKICKIIIGILYEV